MSSKLASAVPKYFLWLIIFLCALYVILGIFAYLFIRDFSLEAILVVSGCSNSTLTVTAQSNSLLSSPAPLTIPLTSGKQTYHIPLNSSWRTLRWSFCPGETIELHGLKFLHQGKPINLNLADRTHLLCIGCQVKTSTSSALLLTPDPSKVNLQIGGLHQIISLYFRDLYKYYYYLPQLILLLSIILFAVSQIPLTPSRLEGYIYSLLWLGFWLRQWDKVRALFPEATYGKNHIIAAAQYLGYSLKADTYLMFIILLGIPGLALCLYFRNRRLVRNHRLTWKHHLISLLLFLGLLMITQLVITQ